MNLANMDVKPQGNESFADAVYRTRLADHLMAVREQRGKPAQDEFMLIADPKDPNPTLLKRWRAWLDAPARKTNPTWKVWLAIEALGDKDFAPELQRLLDQPESQPAPKSILENLQEKIQQSIE